MIHRRGYNAILNANVVARQSAAASGLPRRLALQAAPVAALIACLCVPAAAQEAASTPGTMVGDVLDALHLRREPPPAQDFVKSSRPAANTLDYKPMAPNDPPKNKKTPAQLDALGAELESARAANQRAGARVATPDVAPPRAARRASAAKSPRSQGN